jgi:hypothetical protein
VVIRPPGGTPSRGTPHARSRSVWR